MVFEPTHRSTEIPCPNIMHVHAPSIRLDDERMRTKDWIIENSRTAQWGPYQGSPIQMVVDPTVILAACCFSDFRPGIESVLGRSQLCAPEVVASDTLAMCIRLQRSEKLTNEDVHRVMQFLESMPLRVVRPDHNHINRELIPLDIPLKAAYYLDAAKKKPIVIMSYDNAMIRWSRKLRIPRCRFVRDHRLPIRA